MSIYCSYSRFCTIHTCYAVFCTLQSTLCPRGQNKRKTWEKIKKKRCESLLFSVFDLPVDFAELLLYTLYFRTAINLLLKPPLPSAECLNLAWHLLEQFSFHEQPVAFERAVSIESYPASYWKVPKVANPWSPGAYYAVASSKYVPYNPDAMGYIESLIQLE